MGHNPWEEPCSLAKLRATLRLCFVFCPGPPQEHGEDASTAGQARDRRELAGAEIVSGCGRLCREPSADAAPHAGPRSQVFANCLRCPGSDADAAGWPAGHVRRPPCRSVAASTVESTRIKTRFRARTRRPCTGQLPGPPGSETETALLWQSFGNTLPHTQSRALATLHNTACMTGAR